MGSALTVMPAIMFDEHFDLPLQPTSTMLKPYASDRLRPKGVFRAHVCYNGQEFEAGAYVVDSDGPALFGVTVYRTLCLIGVACTIYQGERDVCVAFGRNALTLCDVLRSHYAAVFGSGRGHLQPRRGHLTLRDGAQPKFLKARPLQGLFLMRCVTESVSN